jgi:hypothetical protein
MKDRGKQGDFCRETLAGEWSVHAERDTKRRLVVEETRRERRNLAASHGMIYLCPALALVLCEHGSLIC